MPGSIRSLYSKKHMGKKGMGNPTNEVSKTKDDDDNLQVNISQTQNIIINRKNFSDSLKTLKEYANVNIQHLKEQIKNIFTSVVETINLVSTTTAYKVILDDVKKIFSDIKDVVPGTVAAYFVGCYDDTLFDGPIGCNPKCAASIHPDESQNLCDDLVVIYEENCFKNLNTKISENAYIYVNSSFTKFLPENINQLNNIGIKYARIVYGDEKGSYKEVSALTPLSELPVESSTMTTQSSSATNAQIAFIVILIILIILLILGGIMLFKSRNN